MMTITESALRRKAARLDHRLIKSRLRGQPHSNNQGLYQLVDFRNNVVLGCAYEATLDEVAAFLVRDEPDLKNTTEWRRLGYEPIPDAIPAKSKWCWSGWGDWWSANQVRPSGRRRRPPVVPVEVEATPENIAKAIFAVNRAAKRRRDAASATYRRKMYGIAREHAFVKRDYYDLKDRGVALLARIGMAEASDLHGGLWVWKVANYRFHSTLSPKGLTIPEAAADQEEFFAEAKPVERGEMRLADAVALLKKLDDFRGEFDRVGGCW
ncbi:hypothetical protein CCC_04073 [Paramagnetospirillum magnetotacticum MS-1]|uniref:Uncharacterized protein n=1 Tax=Paramagnetospirillum magnetotacticum MS-1 TaxID=272627 RepID=A0A0C2UDI1_PARME|nr:hypothetical protein [Paramagnetospirillum magnetotacticum]KIL99557.1 hypothetical protein CCC_04073 [Paramagnetospirillum magnetotacticum MS-1]